MKVRHIQQRDVLDPSLEAELTAKFGLFEYLFKMPKAVPPDSWLVHNSVKPPAPADDERLGTRGFRAWLQPTAHVGSKSAIAPGPANLDDTFAWKSLMREDLSFVDFVDRLFGSRTRSRVASTRWCCIRSSGSGRRQRLRTATLVGCVGIGARYSAT